MLNMMMCSVLSVAQAILFLLCILLHEVSSQCTDPLIYKLNDIQQLITNCTAQIQKYEKDIANLTEKLKKQGEENEEFKELLGKQV